MRSYRFGSYGLAIMLTALSTTAQADDFPTDIANRKGTMKLQPAAPWNIEFAENRCILSRMFDGEYGRHVVFFEQSFPGPHLGMTMAGDRLRKFPRGTWTYFGARNDVPMLPLERDYGEVPDIGPAIILHSVFMGSAEPKDDDGALEAAGIDLEEAGTVDRVILKLGSTGLSFETGNLAAPMQAMNVCTSDLMKSWGLDPEQHAAYTPPRWINSERITEAIQRDYPRKALYRGERGIFRLRVIVELDGSVSDCHAEKSTVTQYLETPACEEMLKARFEPARNALGQTIRSFYATSITYDG